MVRPLFCKTVFLAALAAVMSMPTPAATSADFQFAQTSAQNGALPYRYFEPPGYDPQQSYPLILFLHGAGERGNNNQDQLGNSANGAMHLLDNENLAVQPVFMVAPQCPSGSWWSGTTLRHALSAIDDIAAQYNIDPDRIYITGLSMGGMGTWSAVSQRPELFAAAVPMSGNGNTSFADSVRSIPFWFFHADGDPTVNVAGSDHLVAALRDAGARVIYTRYHVAQHGIWQKAYITPLLFDWLVSQRRGQRNEGTPPAVHITQPTDSLSLFTGAPSISLAGSVDNGGNTVDSVAWGVRGGAGGNATGTTSWSTAGITLAQGANLIRIVATGPSYYAPWDGNTTFNDSIRATRAEGMIYADSFDPF